VSKHRPWEWSFSNPWIKWGTIAIGGVVGLAVLAHIADAHASQKAAMEQATAAAQHPRAQTPSDGDVAGTVFTHILDPFGIISGLL